MIRGIHHTAIATNDKDTMPAFCHDLLGFEAVPAFEAPKRRPPRHELAPATVRMVTVMTPTPFRGLVSRPREAVACGC